MSREILFKAKRKNWRELPKDEWWVEGLPFIQDLDGMEQVCIAHHSISANDYSEICGENKNWFQIDPETICQYTGLTEKDGKRIWENDIVVCRQYIGGNFVDYYIERGFVEMNHGAFGLHRKQGYYRPFKDWLEDYEYEVLGNVFDNSELLGGVRWEKSD